jgi:N-acyl-D-amino-acid deacylase
MDVLITNGLVFDGSGQPPRNRSVGIDAGRFVPVPTPDSTLPSGRTIDAAGMAVMPGFIDAHTHSDYTAYVQPRAESAVHQGVTTHIAGNCGYSCAPLADPNLAAHLSLGYEPSVGTAWHSLGEYFEVLERGGLAVNLACLVGHGSVRAAAMGLDSRPATDDEIEKMSAVLAPNLPHRYQVRRPGGCDGARARNGRRGTPLRRGRCLRHARV